jgi:hypothetical protein
VPSDSFQLSPAVARARFDALLTELAYNNNADDPLFRPVDADDFRVNGTNARDFSNLVENGLVRVTMPLPLNVKVIDPTTGQPSADTFVDLWRAVMPVLNIAMTGPDLSLPFWPPAPRVATLGQDPNGPNRQGGYQHDARFATLQEQARGALFAHAQVTDEPPVGMLDDLAAFQKTLFSSLGAEQLANAIGSGSGSVFPDPDPELNQIEQDGKVVFNRACATCHGGPLHPSTSTGDATLVRPIARCHNIFTACPRPAGDGYLQCPERLNRNARTYQITLASGAIQTETTSDPGRLLLTGQPGDLRVMDVTQLRGIGRTTNFQNNSAATLEEVLDQYDALFRRVARLNPPPNMPPLLSSDGVVLDRGFVLPGERPALLAYLRKL